MIDLHTHSTASDGTFKPEDLIREADRIGLTAIALTDHDTMDGIPAFFSAADNARTIPIAGVEIACCWYGGSLHIVGLFVNHRHEPLKRLLKTIREARDVRNTKILQKLRDMGYHISEDDLQDMAAGGVPGRPHIAAAIVKKGYFAERDDVFRELISKQGTAYVRRYLPKPSAGIAAIHEAGGIAVWAHPAGGVDDIVPSRVRQVARTLKSQGLDGVETHYCDYSQRQHEVCLKITRELNLLPSGGSDFHGGHMPAIKLGIGLGQLAVPDELLEPLRQRAEQYAHQVSP